MKELVNQLMQEVEEYKEKLKAIDEYVNGESNITLRWKCIADKNLLYYEIREGNTWDSGRLITRTHMTEYVVKVRNIDKPNFIIRAIINGYSDDLVFEEQKEKARPIYFQ